MYVVTRLPNNDGDEVITRVHTHLEKKLVRPPAAPLHLHPATTSNVMVESDPYRRKVMYGATGACLERYVPTQSVTDPERLLLSDEARRPLAFANVLRGISLQHHTPGLLSSEVLGLTVDRGVTVYDLHRSVPDTVHPLNREMQRNTMDLKKYSKAVMVLAQQQDE
eukprot:PhM_4_TR14553/c0_g1_i1/m.3610